jgi:hypothetical protein
MGEDQKAAVQQDDLLSKWGDEPSADRKRELQDMLDAWNAPDADHGDRKGPFDVRGLASQERKRLQLGGASVFWLAAVALAGPGATPETLDAALVSLRSDWREPKAFIWKPLHLEGANLSFVDLEGADLGGAYLEGADLSWAQLEGANLGTAHLEGADLSSAHLEGANLYGATLDGKTNIAGAFILEPEDTRPLRVRLLRRLRYGPALGDIHWGDFDLVQLTQWEGWDAVRRLADEQGISWLSIADGHRYAVRAYRQVAQRLRDQGFSDVADRLSDRAQVRQRKLLFRVMLEDWRRPWRLPGDLLRWLFSWFLALLAGYGYHPGRSVFWYLATIFGFAFAYYQATHGLPIGPYHFAQASDIQALQPNEALILSISSFHGRGFFQPIKSLGDPVATLAAAEAIIGLLIEISFIATFTQRFFGAK